MENVTVEDVLEKGPHKHSEAEGESCFEHVGLSTAQKIANNRYASYGCHVPWPHRRRLNEPVVEKDNTSPGVYQRFRIIKVFIVFVEIPLCK
jgi:hypothetical protein